MVLIHKCTIVKHALKAQSLGADMIVADGCECAGHVGENDIGTMVLTPRCVEALDVPVITAGGISTGRQMAAALMLGAQGVYMGSRFLLSEECPVLPAVKNYLAENSTEMDTILLLRSYTNTTRMYRSEVAKRVFEKEKTGCEFKDVAEDMAGRTACRMFYENGDVEHCGTICIGQTGGLIHSVQPVGTIIEDIMDECRRTMSKFN
jgi:nitronate monooxygenase